MRHLSIILLISSLCGCTTALTQSGRQVYVITREVESCKTLGEIHTAGSDFLDVRNAAANETALKGGNALKIESARNDLSAGGAQLWGQALSCEDIEQRCGGIPWMWMIDNCEIHK